ncbi:hypothetical protein C5167_007829 [Papaver somniferum]|nr:hypothetical protein C5167_007829 [Papaver somniferum]
MSINLNIGDSHKKNRVEVSNTKNPPSSMEILPRYMQQSNEAKLSALEWFVDTPDSIAGDSMALLFPIVVRELEGSVL